MATVITGRDIPLFQCLVVASAMELYAKTKMLPNRAYTPTRMLDFAESVLKVRYKRTQMLEAAAHLRAWARAQKGE